MNSTIQTVLEELKKHEPAFHQAEYCSTKETLENYAAPDFWEVGASGKVYSREFVIETVLKRFQEKTEVDTSKWIMSEFQCRQLENSTYMVTYLLQQEDRLTRRISIWRKKHNTWQIVYHQGTVVIDR